MPGDGQEFRHRIQNDKMSFRVVVLTMVAWVVALVSFLMAILPDVPGAQRTNPLYWAIMLPAVAWGVTLITLQPFAVRTLPIALLALPLLASAAAWISGEVAGWIAAMICAALTFAAGLLRQRSALRDIVSR